MIKVEDYVYDHHAVWHTHHFPPDGSSFPLDDDTDMRRFDAVEDRKGVIFVYDADAARVIEICSSREEADEKATKMAKGIIL
jgi:hypothetical protein